MSNIYEAPKADLEQDFSSISDNGDIQVTSAMIGGLEKGAKWSMFMAVLLYIGTGLIALGALFSLFGGLAAGSILILLSAIAGYGITGFIIFSLARFLHKYSSSVKALVISHDAYDLVESQEYFRKYLKWVALLTIIGFIIGLIVAIGAGAYIASMS